VRIKADAPVFRPDEPVPARPAALLAANKVMPSRRLARSKLKGSMTKRVPSWALRST